MRVRKEEKGDKKIMVKKRKRGRKWETVTNSSIECTQTRKHTQKTTHIHI